MRQVLAERPACLSERRACRVLGVSRASVHRARKPSLLRCSRPRRPSPRRIPQAERDAIFDTLGSVEFADQPPLEVYAALLARGVYLCSVRTMYRVLHERMERVEDRRAQRRRHSFAPPRVVARRPNEVWTWDITRLPVAKGQRPLFLYVVLDLYSRYVVGWMVAEREHGDHAAQLLGDAYFRHGIAPHTLTVHSDRGSPMRSHTMADLFDELGVRRSFSRPRVSDDNPFIESHFRTVKYQPDFPRCFAHRAHAVAWVARFLDWYHRPHHHASLALFTPEEVFLGKVDGLQPHRQRTLDQAFARTPHRFPHGPPRAPALPTEVAINPLVAPTVLDLRTGELCS
jgi:putative transposase